MLITYRLERLGFRELPPIDQKATGAARNSKKLVPELLQSLSGQLVVIPWNLLFAVAAIAVNLNDRGEGWWANPRFSKPAAEILNLKSYFQNKFTVMFLIQIIA